MSPRAASGALAALALAALACGERAGAPPPPDAQSPARAPERPNIVLLIGDDYGYPYHGFTGSEVVQTPHLDRLAAEGTVFTQGFATSNVCRPSMWTLLTGLYPLQLHARAERRAGQPLGSGARGRRQWPKWDRYYVGAIRADPDTLPRALSRAGYVSFQAGKFWEGTFDVGGFDDGMNREDVPGATDPADGPNDRVRGLGSTLGRLTLSPVLDFIDAQGDPPFFLWYAPLLPHRPHDPPADLWALYEGLGLSHDARAYYAMCSWFDRGVGQLIEHLERRGLSERTLVVYVSDNGWQADPASEATHHLGGPLGKLSHHELAFRTPIVFRWPGRIPAGRVVEALVSTADLHPTLLSYAGMAAAPGRLGVDLRPLIEGSAGSVRDVLIGSTSFLRLPEQEIGSRAQQSWTRELVFHATTPHWHYVLHETSGEEWLYDRRSGLLDPRDRLADHAERARALRARIEAWKAELARAPDG